MAIIDGTENADFLSGTEVNDSIYGYGGERHPLGDADIQC
jgi:hypothetical protein